MSGLNPGLRTYLPGIGKRTGPDTRGVGRAESQGKATKMTKKTMNTVEIPTYEEVDAIVAKARAMRARAMRDGLFSAVAALKRVVSHRPVNRPMNHKVSEV